jgi:hypothetical protein
MILTGEKRRTGKPIPLSLDISHIDKEYPRLEPKPT